MLQKKESTSLLQKDLGDLVYEKKISSTFFVNTHGSKTFTSILVVVNKKRVQEFKEYYGGAMVAFYEQDFENYAKRQKENVKHSNQNIEDEAVREEIQRAEYNAIIAARKEVMKYGGVVPESDRYLGHEDADGNQLWRVTAMTDQAGDFCRLMKKNGFLCQEFNYDGDAYVANKNLEASLRREMRTCNEQLILKSHYNFMELFQALMHMKIMRTFIDGVLRFGIPPTFVMGVIQPARNCDDKIKQNLTSLFAEEHLKEMYGAKEEA